MTKVYKTNISSVKKYLTSYSHECNKQKANFNTSDKDQLIQYTIMYTTNTNLCIFHLIQFYFSLSKISRMSDRTDPNKYNINWEN